jgi:hypothetical protein
MRMKFGNFFKQRRGLALAILALCAFFLTFVIPRIFFSLDASEKKMFWITFVFGVVIIVSLLLTSQRRKDAPLNKEKLPRDYQELQAEMARCSYELKKHRRWAYGCLIVSWLVLWVGRWSGHPLYSHPIFAIPVFSLAFLAATKSWEKDNKLDVNIAECILEGIKLEKKRGIKAAYFQDLADSYEGWSMWGFAFVRISPSMMILFSLFNAGPLTLLADYLTKFFSSSFTPSLIVYSAAGAILAMAGLFHAKIACQPYRWLLWKLKANG